MHSGPLTIEDARERVRESLAGRPNAPDAVGIEVELFAIDEHHLGSATGRLPLYGDRSVTKIVANSPIAHLEPTGSNPTFRVSSGWVTFEPGAQIEYATTAHHTATAALDDVALVVEHFSNRFADEGVVLGALGVDRWHALSDVPQQLPGDRYRAQAEFYERSGATGALMMRNTSSMQISLEAGYGDVREERWRLVNLLTPLLTSSFSTSPTATHHSGRGAIWQGVDSTRTGHASSYNTTADDAYEAFALRADVMMVWREGGALPGVQGFSFSDWVDAGHPIWGHPTASDLEYHMTTVFPEVRLRGGLMEIRSIDAMPGRWRPAAVALMVGALYDERTRGELLQLLDGPEVDLADQWRRAAIGPGSDDIVERTSPVWRIALSGAVRSGLVADRHLATVERFLERETSLASELGGLSPQGALEWVVDGRDSARQIGEVVTA